MVAKKSERERNVLARQGIKIAKEVSKSKAYLFKVEPTDMESYLVEKLVGIIDKFDSSKGSFEVYCKKSLSLLSHNYLRDSMRSRAVNRSFHDLALSISGFFKDNPIAANNIELASKELGIPADDIAYCLSRFRQWDSSIDENPALQIASPSYNGVKDSLNEIPVEMLAVLEDHYLDHKKVSLDKLTQAQVYINDLKIYGETS